MLPGVVVPRAPSSPVEPVESVEQENPRQFEEWQVKRYNEMCNSRSLSKEDVVFLIGILKECTSGTTTCNPKRLLRSTKILMTAANVMRTLSKSCSEHCDTIHDHGGIQTIVALTDSDPSTAIVATGVLTEIIPYNYSCRQTFLACSGMRGILNQLSGELEQVRMGAAALASIMQGPADEAQVTRHFMRQLGGIEMLIEVIDREITSPFEADDLSINVICNAVGALGMTGVFNTMNQNYIREAGGIPSIVYTLATYVKDGSSRISKTVTSALGNLIARNLPNRSIVCSLNAHHHLLTLLMQSAEISKEKGALPDGTDEILHVITNLITEASMMNVIIDKDKDGIGGLLQLLPVSINNTKGQFVYSATVRILHRNKHTWKFVRHLASDLGRSQ